MIGMGTRARICRAAYHAMGDKISLFRVCYLPLGRLASFRYSRRSPQEKKGVNMGCSVSITADLVCRSIGSI